MAPVATSTAKRQKTYAIIGGRLEDDNREIYAELHRLSGGRVLIFPTASSEPVEVGEETEAVFKDYGFDTEVVPLTVASPLDLANGQALADKIADWQHVYFTGGDQSNIFRAFHKGGRPTRALKALRQVHRSGGLLAGSSAGAAMMSEPMLLGGTSLEAMVHGITQNPSDPGILIGDGMRFFTGALLDQHFIKRGRLARLLVAMAASGHRRGFGIDENTALFIEGNKGRVIGEYGVFFVDRHDGRFDLAEGCFEDFRLSYIDDGDAINLRSYAIKPGADKRRVRASEMAYRAPAHSRRNAFGGYAIYDLMARLVLGDPSSYARDDAEAFDSRTGVNVRVRLDRVKRRTRCLINRQASGLRMTAINFNCSITRKRLSAVQIAERDTQRARTFGLAPQEDARLVLLGSSPLYSRPDTQRQMLALVTQGRPGKIGILAAASAEARRTADEHLSFLRAHDADAVDLGITIDNVEYAAHDEALLETIEGLGSIFICGGNQIRLVETLLHRGEESAVLRAMAKAYSNGAVLAASSGAVAAMPGVMIAGGTSYEALRYGVTSDLGHEGLVIQEGVGLFPSGIADQNMIRGRRLGRLLVACVEENERFGVGICEDSAVICARSGTSLEAAGKHGAALVQIEPSGLDVHGDSFIANGVKVTVLGPGERADLTSGEIERDFLADETQELLATFREQLLREGTDLDALDRSSADAAARHAVKMRIWQDGPRALRIDLECSRDEDYQ